MPWGALTANMGTINTAGSEGGRDCCALETPVDQRHWGVRPWSPPTCAAAEQHQRRVRDYCSSRGFGPKFPSQTLPAVVFIDREYKNWETRAPSVDGFSGYVRSISKPRNSIQCLGRSCEVAIPTRLSSSFASPFSSGSLGPKFYFVISSSQLNIWNHLLVL